MPFGAVGVHRASWMRAVLILLVTTMMVILSCTIVLAGGEDRGPTPTIAVMLDPATQEAKVTQSKLDNVTFQGTAEIDQSSVTTSDLNLQAVVNTGWSISLTPSYFTVTGPATVAFEVEVQVPPGTSTLMTGNVIVRASLKAPLLTAIEGEATAIVTVGQYYKARIDLDDPTTMKLNPGEEGTAEGSVYNDGNGRARFRLSLVDVPEGIRAILSISDFDVSQNDHQPFNVKVTVLEGANSGTHEVTIRAECMDSDGGVAITKEYPLLISVPDSKLPAIGPGLAITAIILCSMFIIINPRSGWKDRHR